MDYPRQVQKDTSKQRYPTYQLHVYGNFAQGVAADLSANEGLTLGPARTRRYRSRTAQYIAYLVPLRKI